MTRPPWLGVEAAELRQRGSTDVPDSTRQLVYRRADGNCESCGTTLSAGRRHLHHRRPRGMGGTRPEKAHRPSNLLVLCPSCHLLIESHRVQALEAGLLVRQGAEPSRVYVWLHDGQQHALDDEGGIDPPIGGAPR